MPNALHRTAIHMQEVGADLRSRASATVQDVRRSGVLMLGPALMAASFAVATLTSSDRMTFVCLQMFAIYGGGAILISRLACGGGALFAGTISIVPVFVLTWVGSLMTRSTSLVFLSVALLFAFAVMVSLMVARMIARSRSTFRIGVTAFSLWGLILSLWFHAAYLRGPAEASKFGPVLNPDILDLCMTICVTGGVTGWIVLLFASLYAGEERMDAFHRLMGRGEKV